MTQPLSSGRWDASGSWKGAVEEEKRKVQLWANSLSLIELSRALKVMSVDTNAFTLYERQVIIEMASLKLKEFSCFDSCLKCGKPSLSKVTDHICDLCADSYIYCWQCSETTEG
jgi:Zn finger protein HypA/HybF involved in hydrogenase expression